MVTENRKSTKTQLYWNTLLRIPVQGIVFIVSIIITRTLDPGDFGIMAVVMMLIGYSNLLTNFGFNEAIIQKSIVNLNSLNSIFTFDLLMSILLALIFYSTSEYIAGYFNMPESEQVIKVMSLAFVFSTFYGLPMAILKRNMDFKSVTLFDAGNSLSMSFLTLVLALQGFGYWSLAYGQLVPLIVISLLLCVKAGYLPRIHFSLQSMKGIFHFGGWNFFKTQLQFFASHIDRFIIGRWFDATSLGYYDKSITLSRAPYDSITININSVMFSSFSCYKDDINKLQRQFSKSLTLITYINFPIYLGLIAIAPYFVSVLLGEKWEPMIVTFQIVLSGFLISSFSGILSSLIVGTGKYKELTLLLLVALVVFAASCFILLRYNIVGIAISYLIFSALLVLLWAGLAMKQVEFKWKDMILPVVPGAAAAMIMFLTVEGLSFTVLSRYTLANMICLIIIGIISYSAYVYFDTTKIITEFKSQIWTDFTKLINRNRVSNNKG